MVFNVGYSDANGCVPFLSNQAILTREKQVAYQRDPQPVFANARRYAIVC